MKDVVTTPSVEIALRSLDEEDRRRVRSWFNRLANWDEDDFVRRHSHALESIPGVYVLKTNIDLWIFFKMEGNTITILDIAQKQSILMSGGVPGAE